MPLFVADDLALDFLNTEYGVPRSARMPRSDQQVLDGLPARDYGGGGGRAVAKRGALLEAALELRQSARKLVERRKAGAVGTLRAQWGARAGPRPSGAGLEEGTATEGDSASDQSAVEAVLVPVAEAIAKLLVEGDFDLIRKCESEDCTLWFHDRTKSHQRRWCSMAVCGNRAKVAAFRARQQV